MTRRRWCASETYIASPLGTPILAASLSKFRVPFTHLKASLSMSDLSSELVEESLVVGAILDCRELAGKEVT